MSLTRDWNQGGSALASRGGERPSIRDILNPLTGLTYAELKALPVDERFDGARAFLSDGKRVRLAATSALAADGDQLVVVPDSGNGRWLVEPGQMVDLRLAIAFSTLDAAVLYTMPTNSALLMMRGYWEATTPFTGGTGSTIGASSSQAPHTTKGDIHGGAAGDVAATLVAGAFIEGTVGADVAAGVLLRGGSTIRHDRITDAFTAGAGFLHVVGVVLANPGA